MLHNHYIGTLHQITPNGFVLKHKIEKRKHSTNPSRNFDFYVPSRPKRYICPKFESYLVQRHYLDKSWDLENITSEPFIT